MENKIKQKLIRSLKELKIYQKLKQRYNFNIRINCFNVYELINNYLINFITEDEKRKLIVNLNALKINSIIPSNIKILIPTKYEDLIFLSNYLDKNGILWASGDKFSDFNQWEGKAKFFELNFGSYITYNGSTNKMCDAIPIKDFIKLYDNIKEEVNKLCI